MIAINQNGEIINLATYNRASLSQLKKDTYYCRDCHKALFIRGGKKRRAHFVHYSETTRQSGESEGHYSVKVELYNQLRQKHRQVLLEHYLSKNRLQPDILINDDTPHAIEFQASELSPEIIYKRNKKYKIQNLAVTWILDQSFLELIAHNKIKIRASIKPFIKQRKYNLSLFFYAASTKELIVCEHLVFYEPRYAYAQIRRIKLKQVSLRHIEHQGMFYLDQFYQSWLSLIKEFRTKPKQAKRATYHWYNWLYKNGYFYETLPSELFLPVIHSHLYHVPVWVWQGVIIHSVIKKTKQGELISIKNISLKVTNYVYPHLKHESSLINQSIDHYLNQLVKLEILSKSCNKYYKAKKIRSESLLSEALNKDNVIIEQLRYNLSKIKQERGR